jgi:hypothetical protein
VSSCGARFVVFFVAAALVAAMLGAADGETSADQPPKSPAELARIIADGVRATTRTPPGSPISLASATSHDNVVEIRYAITDLVAFSRFKGNVETARLSTAALYCNESRRAMLDLGVVLHWVYALADGSDQVEFTVDKSSCASLPTAAPADAERLAALALAAAQTENAGSRRDAGLAVRFAGATAHEGIVDVRFMVVDPATARQNLGRGVAALAGLYCTKYLGPISQGLTLHLTLAPISGPPIFEFIIDKSKC